MRFTVPRRTRAPLLAAAALLVLGASAASAQVNPLWDHYKMYVATPLGPLGIPVTLNDQWGSYNHIVNHLDYWMNPVEKTVLDPPPAQTYPINDPALHYAWWQITPQPNEKLVAITNQFGDATIHVTDAVYLLTPALKNQTGSPPLRNHYKCYICDGQPVNRQVQLRDQFDPVGTQGWTATVTYPRWFCNPTEKIVQGSPVVNPIVDPNQHYTCYEFTPADPAVHPLNFTDQFVPSANIQAGPSQWLCVPTYKNGFTPTTRGTWGKMKTLYR